MKKTIVLITTFFIYCTVCCQNPMNIADSSKSWTDVSFATYPVIIGCGTTYIKFSGDTLINNKMYLKAYQSNDSLQSWTYSCLIHEDSVTQKVFYRTLDGVEGMIYNFSVELGDTLCIYNPYIMILDTAYMRCYYIDSVFVDGSYRERYFFTTVFMKNITTADIWIEGIGSTYGVFNSAFSLSSWIGERSLLCYSENNAVKYKQPPYDTCYMDNFWPSIVSETYDTAYLGIPYEFQVEISDTSYRDTISWSSWLMPAGFWIDTTTGVLGGLPQALGKFKCNVVLKNWGYSVDILDTNIVVVDPLSIISNPIQTIKIFPNPTKDIVNIEIGNSSVMFIKIIDFTGNNVFTTKTRMRSFSIDLSSYPDGIYCLSACDISNKIIMTQLILKY